MTPPVGCRSPNDSRKLGQDLSEFPPARPPAYDRTAPPDPEPEAEPEALIGTSVYFFCVFLEKKLSLKRRNFIQLSPQVPGPKGFANGNVSFCLQSKVDTLLAEQS